MTWRRLLHRGRAGARGQAAAEYVLVTGMLVLIGIAIAATLSAGVKTFVRNTVHAVRTVAP